MPGYDRSRFVGISENNLQEYICGICLEVFIEPTITECCGQTYCYECINEWVSQNNSCPFDRKSLTQNQLKSASKVLISLLGIMKIRCDYQNKGCKSVIKVKDLDRHKENQCLFNSSHNCGKCGLTKLNHTDKMCIDQLSVKLKETSDKLETLQNNYEIMIKEKKTTDIYIEKLLEKLKNLEPKDNGLRQLKDLDLDLNSNIVNTQKIDKVVMNGHAVSPNEGIVWVKCSNGKIPAIGSVIGGKDNSGETVYVGRALHNGNLIPGEIKPSHGVCYVSYMNSEYKYKDYEVLTNPNNCKLEWISYGVFNGDLPSGAIEAGLEDNHLKLFIGRTYHFRDLVVGKVVDSSEKMLYLAYNDKVHMSFKYEILIYKDSDLRQGLNNTIMETKRSLAKYGIF